MVGGSSPSWGAIKDFLDMLDDLDCAGIAEKILKVLESESLNTIESIRILTLVLISLFRSSTSDANKDMKEILYNNFINDIKLMLNYECEEELINK